MTTKFYKRKEECKSFIWQYVCKENNADPDGVHEAIKDVGGVYLILKGIKYNFAKANFEEVCPEAMI